MDMKERAEQADINLEKGIGHGDEVTDLVSKLISDVIRTPGFMNVITSVLSDVLTTWSGESIFKKKISNNIIKMVSGVIDPKSVPKVKLSESALFKNLGRLITLLAIDINDVHKENPTYYADRLKGPINDIIEGTDFGELKEMVDNSEECVAATAKVLIDTLWKYPAKIACLGSVVVTLINMVIKSLKEILKSFDNAAPDLLADLLFSILRTNIDGKEIGLLVNSFIEVIRKLHTGSVFFSEAGIPLLQIDLANKLRDVVSTIDPELMCKVKVALAEDAESITNSIADVILNDPTLFMATTSAFSSIRNPKIREVRKKISVFEDLPAQEVTEAFSKGLVDLDAQEIGEVVNSLLRVINSIHGNKPEIISNLISSIMTAIDIDELKAAAGWMIRVIADAIKPVADEFLTPLPGEDSSDLDNAIASIRDILCKEGGER